MGTISTAKLAGISLILGPVITVVGYFIQQLVIFADAEWGSAASFAALAAKETDLFVWTSLAITIGLLMLAYGILFIADGIRGNGNGDALSRYAQLLITVGTTGFILAIGISLTAATYPEPAAAAAAAFLTSSGIQSTAGIFFSLGFAAIFFAMASRDEYNTMLANIAGLVGVLAFAFSIIGAVNTSSNEQMTQLVGLTYFVHTAYAGFLGWRILSSK